jgi:hypothetical protein
MRVQHILDSGAEALLLSEEDLFCSPIDLFYTVYLPLSYLLIFLPQVLITKTPAFVIAGLYHFDCFVLRPLRLCSDPTTRCIWNKGSPPSFSFHLHPPRTEP